MRLGRFGIVLVVGVAACHADAPAPARVSASASASASAEAVATATATAAATATATGTASASALADAGRVEVVTDWCVPGISGLDEDACYVLPEARPTVVTPSETVLLVYLHGIVPNTKESVQKTTVQSAVVAAARRANAAAIVPRGRRGIGPEGAREWWAWPTSPAAHAQLVKEIVARWALLKKKLEAIHGAPFARTYLAGSSNGAYFLSAIALRGDADELGFPIDGYGAMSGGAPGGRGADALKGRAPRPVYVGFGTYDRETTKGAKALAAVFESAHWPVKLAEHPFGHGAREIYLDEAFVFWRQ